MAKINLGFTKEIIKGSNKVGFGVDLEGYHAVEVTGVYHNEGRNELQLTVETETYKGKARLDLTRKSDAQAKRLYDYLTNVGYKFDKDGNFDAQSLIGKTILIEVSKGYKAKNSFVGGNPVRIQEAYTYLEIPFDQSILADLAAINNGDEA